MNYKQVLDYMYSQLPMFQRIGAAAYKANLDNTIAISDLSDHPYRNFPVIHIAGTNGKGSVSHMLASIMQEGNLKTGLYTSPHLRDFRERMKINGLMIAEEYVVDYVERYQEDFNRIRPSFFEMTFGMAMKWFSDSKVDIAIIETGMGGRLDSTNVITPLMSVITNIGLDHMQYLGESLPEIALEKAGIIKPEVPIVIGETLPESIEVFKNVAHQLNAPLIIADQIVTVVKDGRQADNQWLNATVFHSGYKTRVECPLPGNYQLKNLATLVASVDLLKATYPDFSSLPMVSGIKNTLKNTNLLGRWQILNKKPLTICDIGHNRDGIAAVVSQLQTLEYSRLHFVIGVVNDKDIDSILSLLPMNATYYFCKADIPRGLDATQLKEMANHYELYGEIYPSVKEAYETACKNASDSDVVFVGGSAFVVAEIV